LIAFGFFALSGKGFIIASGFFALSGKKKAPM